MKYILILSILAALLVGCAVVPVGSGGDGNFRGRDFNDGNYRHYSYLSDHANQGDPYRGYDS